MRKLVLGAAILSSLVLPVSAEYSRFNENELTPGQSRELVVRVMNEAVEDIRDLRNAYYQQCEQVLRQEGTEMPDIQRDCSEQADEKMVSLLSTAVTRAYSAGQESNNEPRTRGW